MGNGLFRWFFWVFPILMLWITRKWTEIPSNSRPIPPSTNSFDASSVYLLISKPQNMISLSLIEQLQPATVYVAYQPIEEESMTRVQKQLPSTVQWCHYDPFGDKLTIQKNTETCLNMIPSKIDGVIFNTYGAVGDGTLQQHTNLVSFKLIGNLIMLHKLLEQGRLKDGARILLVGSESARGLPKMGFAIPNLGTTIESIQSYLTGWVYSSEQVYRWEQAYADLCAIMVLFVKHLTRINPQYYFSIVSPGMTDESFNPSNAPNPTWTWRIKMWYFHYILFPILQRKEIVKTSYEGASLLLQAMSSNNNWEYPSGTFVGAKSGTGGPICDQSILEGGKMFRNEHLQQIAYQAVQPFIV